MGSYIALTGSGMELGTTIGQHKSHQMQRLDRQPLDAVEHGLEGCDLDERWTSRL